MGYSGQVHVVYGFFLTWEAFRKVVSIVEEELKMEINPKNEQDESWIEDSKYDLARLAEKNWGKEHPNIVVQHLHHDVIEELEKTDKKEFFIGANCLKTDMIWTGYAGGVRRDVVFPHLTVGESPLLTGKSLVEQVQDFEKVGHQRYQDMSEFLQDKVVEALSEPELCFLMPDCLCCS